MTIITKPLIVVPSGKARAKIVAMEGQDTPPSWRYTGSSTGSGQPQEDIPAKMGSTPTASVSSVKWTASEYIAQDKDGLWYAVYAVVTVIVVLAVQLIARSYFSTAIVLMLCIGVAVYAGRKPQLQEYEVSQRGVRFAGKAYLYGEFRSFAIVQDGAVPSIWLIPLKRLKPPLTMYFEPKDSDKIVSILSDYLPHEQHDYDLLERLMRYIRF